MSSILGGRFWGWLTAWFNLLGLIFVVSSVDAGVFQLFRDLVLAGIFKMDVSAAAWQGGGIIWILGTAVILASHAALNHFGIRVTTILTDFSGYWIFIVAIILTIALLVWSPVALDFSRLFTFTNFTGDPGGGVWPVNSSMFVSFILGLLLVTYTVTGFDASAHTSEETHQAAINVPKGMWQSVFWSVVFGYFMVCAFVLVMPSTTDGAAQGYNVFLWLMDASKMPTILLYLLFVGIVISNYLCGLAGLTSCSRMMYAFARDGGLPASKALSHVSAQYRTPTYAIWVSAVLSLASCLYGGAFVVLAAGCAVFLYISYVMPVAAGIFAEGKSWKEKGPFNLGALSKPNAVIAVIGGLILAWVGFQPPNQLVGYLIVGLLVVLLVYWFAIENRRFEGPPTGEKIAARQSEIAQIEAQLDKGGD